MHLKQTRLLLAILLVAMLLLNSSIVLAQDEGEQEPTQPAGQSVDETETVIKQTRLLLAILLVAIRDTQC